MSRRPRPARWAVLAAGLALAAAPLGTARAAPAGWIDVRAFGAAGDGRTDDTAAVQRALDEAARTGSAVLLTGRFACRQLVLPSGTGGAASIAVLGTGAGVHGSPQDQLPPGSPSSAIVSLAGGDDLVVAPRDPLATYRFEDLAIVGPDLGHPRTHTSGDGLNLVAGQAGVRVLLRNVEVTGFNGPGKAGIRLGSGYYGRLEGVRAVYNHFGLLVDGFVQGSPAWNANTISGCAFRRNTFGARIRGADGLAAVGNLFEGNERTGLELNDAVDQAWIATYFEDNDTDHAEDAWALAVYARDGRPNQHVTFLNTHLSPPGAWGPATAYAEGAEVHDGRRYYRSRRAGNSGRPPERSPAWWAPVPGSNRVLVGGEGGGAVSVDTRFVGGYANGAGPAYFVVDRHAADTQLDELHLGPGALDDRGARTRVTLFGRRYGETLANPALAMETVAAGPGGARLDAAAASVFDVVLGPGIPPRLAGLDHGRRGQRVTIRWVNRSGAAVRRVRWPADVLAAPWGAALAPGAARSVDLVFDGERWAEAGRSLDVPTPQAAMESGR